jgi:glutathione S-transferase
MTMLRLYDYAASGNCYKVRLLLHLLDRPYERMPVDIFGGDTLTAAFGRMNPARRTPVLETADGVFVPESNAILLHLAEGTRFLPEDRDARAQAYRWLFFEQSHLEPTVGSARFWRLTGRDERDPQRFATLVDSARSSLAMLDAGLDGRVFLAGDEISVADVAMYAYTHVAHEAGIDMEAWPAVLAWLDRARATDRWMHDLEPYPENARPGAGRSVHN